MVTACLAAMLCGGATTVGAQVTPPDLNVCDGVEPCDAPRGPVCDGSGFEISLTSFTPAATTTGGYASYAYSICSPAEGTCSGDSTRTCLDNTQCSRHGAGTCSRTCAVDSFNGLSHTDIGLPALLGGTCISADTEISVGCSSPANGSYGGVLGDGSCFDGDSPVAKCDAPNLSPGQCLTVTISIAGELNAPGLGAAVLVDKPGNVCNSACLAGPSCDSCILPPPGGGECLTRTIGFWGNHPWITNDYAPVTVCGHALGCGGADDGKSNPSCPAFSCGSIMEGLCSVGGETRNTSYVNMVRQLTAAKLNLNATNALFDGACVDFEYEGKSIEEWIDLCEGMCDRSKAVISRSGCIEALDAFNNSQDTGFDTTPSPFDRPSVNDHGEVSGADPNGCQEAHGTAGHSTLVIGEKTKDFDCQ